MVEFTPKRIDEAGAEDVQDIQKDPAALAAKYVTPIDNIRSIAKPGPGDDFYDALEPDNTRWAESRAHAFMRYIGFPVVAGSTNEFYNPGFDPLAGGFLGALDGTDTLKQNVFSAFLKNSVLKSMVEIREQDPKDLRELFVRRDIASSVYALILRHK
jgi:hypothetical protein